MDLVGEIVEKDVAEPTVPVAPEVTDLKKIQELKIKRENAFLSRKKGRLSGERSSAKRRSEPEPSKARVEAVTSAPKSVKDDLKDSEVELSEAEKIHKENMERISSMTEEDIEQERQELLQQLNPKLVQSLINRAEKRMHNEHHHHHHAEGYEGWIGGMKTADGVAELSQLDKDDIDRALGIEKLHIEETSDKEEHEHDTRHEHESRRGSQGKNVRFEEVATVRYEDLPDDVSIDESGWEDVEDINDLAANQEIAHPDYQLVNEEEPVDEVHFPKPAAKTPEFGPELDINDPEFYDKLHDKFYPDLPKETSKLAWMTDPVPQKTSTTYESISDMRFDFQGNLVELESTAEEVPTYLGLHHHSANPHLPGYTLGELVHLSRSVVAGQRCLALQMLGRILHKLGLHKYNIMPVQEEEDNAEFSDNIKQVRNEFEKMMWQLIQQLRVIESIEEAADEKRTRNLSVRNYAIEALWLWKQGGGQTEATEDDELAKFM